MESSTDEMKPPNPERPKTETAEDEEVQQHGWRFWFTISLLSLIGFAAAVDNTIIFTALPTITRQIGGQGQYVWIANSYVLAECAIQPLVGQLCNIFGRKKPFYISVCIFAIGAGVAGGASSPAMLIGGRTVQGLGCGGIFVLIDLIMCDITSQRERGKYLGFVMGAVGIGTTIGPLIGGALVQASWRWVFYITLPFCGLCLVSYPLLRLNYQRPKGWKHALAKFDWFGNTLFIASIISLCIGLIFGSYLCPWSSWRVLVPLILGVVGWTAFHIFEATPLCKQPTMPPQLFNNPTAFICFILTWIFGMLVEWFTYMMPLYFQAVKGYSPLRSAVDILPFNAVCMAFGILAGMIMTVFGIYIPLHAAVFAFTALGMGLLSTLTQTSSTAEWVIWQCFIAIGLGSAFGIILPAILASLPSTEVASATALFSFMRSFGMVFGVTIPSVIFNAEFDKQLNHLGNQQLITILGNGRAYGSASDGVLNSLSSQDHSEAIGVYTQALKAVWYGAMAFSLLGFVLVFGEKHYDLGTKVNKDFDIERKLKNNDSA